MMNRRSRYLVLAKIVDLKDASSVMYQACSQCYTRLLYNPQINRWVCLKCGQQLSSDNISMRYRVALDITDGSATCSVTVFGQAVDQYFGASACDFHRYHEAMKNDVNYKRSFLKQSLATVLVGRMFYFGFRGGTANSRHRKTTLAHLVGKHATCSSARGTGGCLTASQMLSPDQDKENMCTILDTLKSLVYGNTESSVQPDTGGRLLSPLGILCDHCRCMIGRLHSKTHNCLLPQSAEQFNLQDSCSHEEDDDSQNHIVLSCDSQPSITNLEWNRHAKCTSSCDSSNTPNSLYMGAASFSDPGEIPEAQGTTVGDCHCSQRDPEETFDSHPLMHTELPVGLADSVEIVRAESITESQEYPGSWSACSVLGAIDFSETLHTTHLLEHVRCPSPSATSFNLSMLGEGTFENCSDILIPVHKLSSPESTNSNTHVANGRGNLSKDLQLNVSMKAENSQLESPVSSSPLSTQDGQEFSEGSWDTLPESEDLDAFIRNLETESPKADFYEPEQNKTRGTDAGMPDHNQLGAGVAANSHMPDAGTCPIQRASPMGNCPISEDLDEQDSAHFLPERRWQQAVENVENTTTGVNECFQVSSKATRSQISGMDESIDHQESPRHCHKRMPVIPSYCVNVSSSDHSMDGSLDLFEQSEDLFSNYSATNIHHTRTFSDCPKLVDVEGAPVRCSNHSNTAASWHDVSHVHGSNTAQSSRTVDASSSEDDVVFTLPATSAIVQIHLQRRKSVRFPSSSKLAEAENISSIDRQMEANFDSPRHCGRLPERSCLKLSESLSSDRSAAHMCVEPSSASLVSQSEGFVVDETPESVRTHSIQTTAPTNKRALHGPESRNLVRHASSSALPELKPSTDAPTLTFMPSSPDDRKSPYGSQEALDSANVSPTASVVCGSQDLFEDSLSVPEPHISGDHSDGQRFQSTPLQRRTAPVCGSQQDNINSTLHTAYLCSSQDLFSGDDMFSDNEQQNSISRTPDELANQNDCDITNFENSSISCSGCSQDLFD